MRARGTGFGWQWRLARGGVSALVLCFLVAPLAAIVPLSFTAGIFLHYPLPGFSLRWYSAVLASAEWRHALANSLIVGTSATAIATLLGTLAALGIGSFSSRWAALLSGVLIAPMIVPVIITALGLYLLLATVGLTATYTGLILSHALICTPFVFVTVGAALQTVDPILVRAAASLGSSRPRAFFGVTLPLILPGVISGALLAFATSFDEVVMTLFIAGPAQRTLPRQMFDGIRESIDPSITAVATLLTAVAVALLASLALLRRRSVSA